MAETYQNYESLVMVVSKALGGSKSTAVADAPKTVGDLEARMKKAFG